MIQNEHNNAHFTEHFVLYSMNIIMIDDEHNNAHFIERFLLYRMNIMMHILLNVSYDR